MQPIDHATPAVRLLTSAGSSSPPLTKIGAVDGGVDGEGGEGAGGGVGYNTLPDGDGEGRNNADEEQGEVRTSASKNKCLRFP